MGLDVLGEVVTAHEPLVADGAGEPATPLLLGELHSMWNGHKSELQYIHMLGTRRSKVFREGGDNDWEEKILVKECIPEKEETAK